MNIDPVPNENLPPVEPRISYVAVTLSVISLRPPYLEAFVPQGAARNFRVVKQ
ncbi:hypothetical protein ABIB40_004012 [Pedobacter sp. UYP30]